MTAKLSWQKVALILGALAIAGAVLALSKSTEAAALVGVASAVVLAMLEGKK